MFFVPIFQLGGSVFNFYYPMNALNIKNLIKSLALLTLFPFVLTEKAESSAIQSIKTDPCLIGTEILLEPEIDYRLLTIIKTEIKENIDRRTRSRNDIEKTQYGGLTRIRVYKDSKVKTIYAISDQEAEKRNCKEYELLFDPAKYFENLEYKTKQ